MRKFVLLVALFLTLEFSYGAPRTAPNVHGETARNGRIIGGSPAQIENFPHMLALFDLSWMGFICGASVIQTHWALTAAWCLHFRTPPYLINLLGGTTDRTSGGILFFVDFYTVHPQYEHMVFSYDVGLIRTASDSPMTGPNVAIVPISPLCNQKCCQSCEAEPATFTGWGVNEQGLFPANLNQITLPIISTDECVRAPGNDDDYFFCVHAELGKDTCTGDQGSPIVRDVNGQRVQIGIVSWRSDAWCGNNPNPEPTLNTRIEFPVVRNWITSVSGI